MKRGLTGKYEIKTVGGEKVRAFIPDPLPPREAVDLSGKRQRLLDRAMLELGRLDSVSLLLRSPAVLADRGDTVIVVGPFAFRSRRIPRRSPG